jgi:hypothetical protein
MFQDFYNSGVLSTVDIRFRKGAECQDHEDLGDDDEKKDFHRGAASSR